VRDAEYHTSPNVLLRHTRSAIGVGSRLETDGERFRNRCDHCVRVSLRDAGALLKLPPFLVANKPMRIGERLTWKVLHLSVRWPGSPHVAFIP